MANHDISKEEKIARRQIRHRNELGWGLGLGGGAAVVLFGSQWIINGVSGLSDVNNSFLASVNQAGPATIAGIVLATVVGVIVGVVRSHKSERIDKRIKARAEKLDKKSKKVTKVDEVNKEPVPLKEEPREETPFRTEKVTTDVIKIIDVETGKVLGVLHKGPVYNEKEGTYSNKKELQRLLEGMIPERKDCIIEYNGKTVAEHEPYQGDVSDMTRRNYNIRDIKEEVIPAVMAHAFATPVEELEA